LSIASKQYITKHFVGWLLGIEFWLLLLLCLCFLVHPSASNQSNLKLDSANHLWLAFVLSMSSSSAMCVCVCEWWIAEREFSFFTRFTLFCHCTMHSQTVSQMATNEARIYSKRDGQRQGSSFFFQLCVW
jgi:hypothetical protein